MRDARLALGGVAHKPWHPAAAERELVGSAAQPDSFETAAQTSIKDAQAHPNNEFKITLAERLIARTLGDLAKAGG